MLERVVAIASLVAVGCGGGQGEVAVKGKDTELVRSAGDWEGDYEGIGSARTGTIKFSLQLGRHVAEGELVMSGSTPLKIEFVQVEEGKIKGTLAPYTDPNCSCQVETSFLGNVAGETISGMFETKIQKTGQI